MPDPATPSPTEIARPERRRAAPSPRNADRPDEPRYRDLVDRLPAAVFIQPLEVRAPATFVSERIADLTGYTPEELLREREFLVRFMLEEDVAPTLALAQRCDRTLEPFRARYRIRRRDGRVVWLQSEADVVRDESGTPLHWLGFVIDVTAEQEALAAVAESEARFRSVWESSDMGIALIGPDGAVEALNPALRRMLGHDGHGPDLPDPADLMEPAEAALAAAQFARLASGDADRYQAERRLRRADGSDLWLHVTSSAVRDGAGRLLRAVNQVEDVTVRREAERALAEREELFRSTFEEAAVGMAIEAPDGTILQANRAFCTLFGHSPVDVRGLTYREMLAEEHVAHAERQIARLMAGELRSYTEERRFRHRDGSILWCTLNVAAVRGPDGRPERMIIQVEDITARKDAEARLAEREAHLREVFDHASAGIAAMGADGTLLETNPAFRRMLGHAADDLRQMAFPMITYPDDRPAALAAFRRLRDGQVERDVIEIRLMRRDGGIVWTRANASCVRGPDGEPERIIAQVEDISAVHLAQQALAASEQRFRALVERSTDTMVIADREGRVRWVSPAVAETLGVTPDQVIGTSILDGVHPDDRAAATARFERLRTIPGTVERFEHRVLHADGAWRWVEVIGANQFENPAVAGAVFNVRDITVRKEAERAMAEALDLQRQAVADLEALDRQRGDFLAMVAHDFRTPLTAIQGYADLIAHLHPDDQDLAACAATISESAQRLNRMVGDLLTVETLERRLDQLALDPTDLGALVTNAADGLRGAWPDREIRLDLAGGLPPVAVDRDQMMQAVTNLVGNALKYSPDHAPMTVRTRLAGNAVEIVVEDGGFGIPADRLDAVFDKYARVRTDATRGVEGVGLGLPIVRAIARAHGGDAHAKSVPGEGSTFVLALPLTPARLPAEPDAAPRDHPVWQTTADPQGAAPAT